MANKSSVPVSICVVMLFPRVVNVKPKLRGYLRRSFAKGPFNDDRQIYRLSPKCCRWSSRARNNPPSGVKQPRKTRYGTTTKNSFFCQRCSLETADFVIPRHAVLKQNTRIELRYKDYPMNYQDLMYWHLSMCACSTVRQLVVGIRKRHTSA